MTVQELIDELIDFPDKSETVVLSDEVNGDDFQIVGIKMGPLGVSLLLEGRQSEWPEDHPSDG